MDTAEHPQAQEVYDHYVRALSPAERLRLMALGVAEDSPPSPSCKRDIMELHGLGAEIWEGVDAQSYVNELRQEWDERS